MTISHESINENKSEFSRVTSVEKIRKKKLFKDDFKASAQECEALTRRLKVLSVTSFSGDVQIVYVAQEKSYTISGMIKAQVTQECRTTSNPVPQEINEAFEEFLVTSPAMLPSIEEALESDKTIELLEGEEIDYGEIAVQWLILSLDPYPRAEGELFEHIEHDIAKTNPFAALKTIKIEPKVEK